MLKNPEHDLKKEWFTMICQKKIYFQFWSSIEFEHYKTFFLFNCIIIQFILPRGVNYIHCGVNGYDTLSNFAGAQNTTIIGLCGKDNCLCWFNDVWLLLALSLIRFVYIDK